MKTKTCARNFESANALVVTMILTATALLTLSGIMAWSSGGSRASTRYNQYTRAVAAAEAATQKAECQLTADFLNGGEALVDLNLGSYAQAVPATSDSSYWGDWQFSDGQGNIGSTYVQSVSTSNLTVLNSTYAGLKAYVSTYSLVSDAKQTSDFQGTTAGVMQQLLLTRIPIFQFAMFSSSDMEIACAEPLVIDGVVHSNGNLYVEPDSTLTFDSAVTAVGSIVYGRDPLDSRAAPYGPVIYEAGNTPNAPALTLPIGTTNSSAAIAQIIQPPPAGESPNSAMGLQRFYNKVDMIVTVSSTGVNVTSGIFNGCATLVPSNQVNLFLTVSSNFYDMRESKTVLPVDFNVGAFVTWSGTNTTLRPALGTRDVCSIYFNDQRTMPSANLAAVRVYNGLVLPSLGLTIATADPIYVLGNYNQTNAANLYTANTSTTLPAQLAGDAVTVLSPNWNDANSSAALAVRAATATTLNAALIAGMVYTTNGNYSGGMENFIRFLENWGTTVITYNGSLVQLFPSSVATNLWGEGNIYGPPTRAWSFDNNFNNPAKLPPLTPSFQTVARSQWVTLAPNSTTASTNVF